MRSAKSNEVCIDGNIISIDLKTGRYALRPLEHQTYDKKGLETHRSVSGVRSDLQHGAPEDGSVQSATDYLQQQQRHLVWLTNELPMCDIRNIPRPAIADFVVVAFCLLQAMIMITVLRLETLQTVVEGLRRRAKRKSSPSTETIIRSVEIYRRARVLFYNPADRCMLNSLSLALFLSRHGIFPQWSFGVKLNPFAAHCWLETDEFVLESLSSCRAFQTIMVL